VIAVNGAAAWPVRVAAGRTVAVGSALWRWQGQLNLTVMVKATFAFVPDGPMSVAPPEPIYFADLHEHDNPARSLRAAREIVPQLRQADVVLYGCAYAPPSSAGQSRATRSAARLALGRDGKTVLDKRLLVLGDRKRGVEEPAGFERLSLGYERALGGVGCPDNPLGVGLGASTETLPNFVHPIDPTGRVACFGPIPSTFPERKKLLHGASRLSLEQAQVAEIPPSLDWSYFQCAPADQRLDTLRGDEWLELEGLTPELRLRTKLPGARALCRVYGAAPGAPVPDAVPLVADLMQIFAEPRLCSLVWRGSFPLHDERLVGQLVVLGAIELPGEAVSWPSSVAELVAAPGAPPPAASPDRPLGDDGARTVLFDAEQPLPLGPGERPLEATRVLGPQELARAGVDLGTPFALAAPASAPDASAQPAAQPIPGAPWSPAPAPLMPLPAGLREGTLALDGPPPPGLGGPAFMAAAGARPGAQPDEAARVAHAQAEAQRNAEAEAEARRKAEAEAEAQRNAEAEAEARRKAEAERFAAEQAEAKAEQARRALAEQEHRKQAATELRRGMYGGFKKK
jgi:hypothetical protein